MSLELAERLAAIEERMGKACARSGRGRASLTLLAVSKVFPPSAIEEAYGLGLREFGENYVQEFEGKFPVVKDLPGARFHFIGHLQSNKARRAAQLFSTIETVDSEKLARRLNEPGTPLDIYLEVKLSDEDSKAGCPPEELGALVAAVRGMPNLTLRGLMTMPPWSEDAERSRPYFHRLAELAREHGVEGLSMGMSHDFEVAIEEGATLIRVGTALFGKRRKPATT